MFGGIDNLKTLRAHNVGAAVVTAQTLDGSDLMQNIIVTVSEKKMENGTKQTVFEDTGEKHIIEPNIYGMHLLSANDHETLTEAYNDLNVQTVRMGGSQLLAGTEESESLLNSVREFRLSLILDDFATATVSELVKEVKALVELTKNDALCLEMGNEVYADSYKNNVDGYIENAVSFIRQ